MRLKYQLCELVQSVLCKMQKFTISCHCTYVNVNFSCYKNKLFKTKFTDLFWAFVHLFHKAIKLYTATFFVNLKFFLYQGNFLEFPYCIYTYLSLEESKHQLDRGSRVINTSLEINSHALDSPTTPLASWLLWNLLTQLSWGNWIQANKNNVAP